MPTENDLRDLYDAPLDAGAKERLQQRIRELARNDVPAVPVVRRRRVWVPLLAAALVVAVTVGVFLAIRGSGDGAATHPVTEPTPAATLVSTSAVPATSGPTTSPATRSTPTSVDPVPATSMGNPSLPRFVASVSVRDGATGVPISETVTVSVPAGYQLTDVALTTTGAAISGEFSDGSTRWTSLDRLAYDSAYTLTATARGADSSAHAVRSTFHTKAPKAGASYSINIADGATVGIAAPIEVSFSIAVVNKAAAERAFTVTTSQGDRLTGNWAWGPDQDYLGKGAKQSQMRWRPTVSTVTGGVPYWPAGTRVTMAAAAFGVDLGNGIGVTTPSMTTTFRVRAESRVFTADASTGQLVVSVDGRTTATYPATFVPDDKPMSTGIHPILGKEAQLAYPCSIDPGFTGCIPLSWPVRLTNSGEFIGAPGTTPLSYPTLALSVPDAKAVFDLAMYGDPVIVSGTAGAPVGADDGNDAWSFTAAQWQAMSALD